jgi:TonB family protein
MDWEKYNFKDVFRLRIRICLLIVLVIFILGFFFSPEVKTEREVVEPDDSPLRIIPVPQDEVVNIAEIPKNDPDKILDKKSYDDRKTGNEVDVTVDDPFENVKNPNVGFGEPIYIPHQVKPKPLNLDKVKFEYPKSMRILGVEGIVYLQLFIDKKGNVRNVVLMNSLHPALEKVAVENAWKIKFSPAEQRDKPVAVWYAFWVEFKIE